ncbi:DJ-1/PfpI family protein [Thalassospira xiamenensis M-5 = DSM 17429]|uniref:DJ-1/PfpI family protein n=1 Tax=Thalassospira xiamenensis M-5 = DSM 17429 TaxID=1123366 RepID=A0AB72UHG6_9PROT|nr:DJ-1/PfpI family protein [Thalassospira xiamenensis]AJD53572.1 DJ-1/PfpI family protein [Thalassospira xiamenensis M-5 = DSM 17429]SIT09099.1 DJ-1/PfpI family protein [Thalassospira xiamenensis M-5 = DSM 17429]
MEIAIVTLDGFNELDSFVALSILNRAKGNGLRAVITGAGQSVTSMNGIEVRVQEPLSFTATADVVLFGSGIHTRDHINDPDLMAQINLDPSRQMIGAQCSGVLFLHKLGLLPATITTDTKTRSLLARTDTVLEDRPLVAQGNIVTSGGCLSSQYLAGWVLARALGTDRAMSILEYVAPVGQKSQFTKQARDIIVPQLDVPAKRPLYC